MKRGVGRQGWRRSVELENGTAFGQVVSGPQRLLMAVAWLGLGGANAGSGQARGRRRSMKLARQISIYMCHVTLGHSQRLVGTMFGRHRTTVRYVCARIEDRRDEPSFDRMLVALESALLVFTATLCAPRNGGLQ